MPTTIRTAVDLFSGCGGLSLGLQRAGFSVLAAVERDELAMETYRLNHPDTRTYRRDIRYLSASQVRRDLSLRRGQLDLLAGCPPCQGFSSLRTLNGSKQNADPTLNDLVFQVTKFAKALLPKALMIENVPGLKVDARFARMTAILERLGYKWDADVFDAADFGVPQRRRRMILIALRNRSPEFAQPEARRRTVRQAIGRLKKPKKSDDPLHNYKVNRAPHVTALISRIPKDGGSRSSLGSDGQLACHQRQDGFHDVYGRMRWRDQSPTITGGCINPSKGRFLHPQSNRAITLREAAILQGFPADYQFEMRDGIYRTAQMIGNAFPPGFASHHARHLLLQM